MSFRSALRVDHQAPLARDPRATPLFDGGKRDGREALGPLLDSLAELQTRLHASATHSLLVVLQGRDASGKDGALRHVLGKLTPLGFSTHAFGPPTPAEEAHDFLWRVHSLVPGRGELVVFNRSHYEDVLVRRVHRLDPEERWRPRYAAIRAFERLLCGDADTVIVKLFLHVSADEQAQRLRRRLERPDKRWKFNPGDLEDRRRWTEYDAAYGDALRETDTDEAPWYVIPADRKWYRDLAIAHVLHETLDALDLRYPEPEEDLSRVRIS